jgi:hypothetical protein
MTITTIVMVESLKTVAVMVGIVALRCVFVQLLAFTG